MGYAIGPKLKIDGESGYRQSMEQIIQQGKTLQAEMEAVAKGYKAAGDETADYERKTDVLSRQIANQKDMIKLYTEQMERSAVQYGENSKETLKYKEQIFKASGELATMEQNLEAVNDGEQEYQEETAEATQKTSLFSDVLKADLVKEGITKAVEGIKNLANGIKETAKAMVQTFTDTANWADELNTLSIKTGVSTDKLQEWEYMSKLLDVDINTLTGSNTKLIRTMASAQDGTASAVQAFSQLGVEFQNADGSLRSSEEVLFEVAGALGNVANETERDALSMQIFGRSALELNPLIKAGSDEIERLSQEAHDVGYVLDKDAIGALNRTQDAMDRMKNAGDGLKRQLSSEFAPVVADAFESVLPAINKFGSTIADVFKGNKDVADFVDEVIESVEGLIDNFEQNAPQFLEQGERLIKSLVEGVQRTVPRLVELAVPMLVRLAQSLISNLGTILDAGIKILLALINGLIQALPSLIQQVPKIVTTITTVLLNNAPLILQSGIKLILALIEGILKMMPEIMKSAIEIAVNFVKSIINKAADFKNVGRNMVEGIMNGISNAKQWIKDKIKSWVNDITDWFKKLFGIHSPSTVMAKMIGAPMAQGIGAGFEDAMGAVARDMGEAIPVSFGAAGSYRQTNLGGVTINVQGAEGQNVQELADEIMFRMQSAVNRREAVFA